MEVWFWICNHKWYIPKPSPKQNSTESQWKHDHYSGLFCM